MSTREKILERAKACVCGGRDQDYGTPENNFETIGLLWGVYLSAAHSDRFPDVPIDLITGKDVALMMGLLKIARAANGDHVDNFVDLAGYAACAADMCIGTINVDGTHTEGM